MDELLLPNTKELFQILLLLHFYVVLRVLQGVVRQFQQDSVVSNQGRLL